MEVWDRMYKKHLQDLIQPDSIVYVVTKGALVRDEHVVDPDHLFRFFYMYGGVRVEVSGYDASPQEGDYIIVVDDKKEYVVYRV
jgi:hypothetical protein